MNKSTQIHIRISNLDKEVLQKLAENKQMSMSEFIVDCIRRKGEAMFSSVEDKKITSIFEFGFEEMEVFQLPNKYKFYCHTGDFEKGGKMEKFSDYSLRRFKNEFQATVCFR